MISLKNLLFLAVLIAAACGVYVSLNRNTESTVPPEVGQNSASNLVPPKVQMPAMPALAEAHVWHLFVVITPRRDALGAHLHAEGIETMIHYPKAIHAQPAYRDVLPDTVVPNAERLQHEVLSLPMSPVMTDEQVDHVIAAVNRWPLGLPPK